MRERSVWSSARHASDWPSTARSDEIDCVATMGIRRNCRVSANLLVAGGSSSPPRANGLVFVAQKTVSRELPRAPRRAPGCDRSDAIRGALVPSAWPDSV